MVASTAILHSAVRGKTNRSRLIVRQQQGDIPQTPKQNSERGPGVLLVSSIRMEDIFIWCNRTFFFLLSSTLITKLDEHMTHKTTLCHPVFFVFFSVAVAF